MQPFKILTLLTISLLGISISSCKEVSNSGTLSSSASSGISCERLDQHLMSDGKVLEEDIYIYAGIDEDYIFYKGGDTMDKGVKIDDKKSLSYNPSRGECFLLECARNKSIKGYEIALATQTADDKLKVEKIYLDTEYLEDSEIIEKALNHSANRQTLTFSECSGSL